MSLLDFCAELSRATGIPWRIDRIDLSEHGTVKIDSVGLTQKRIRAIETCCRKHLPCYLRWTMERVA